MSVPQAMNKGRRFRDDVQEAHLLLEPEADSRSPACKYHRLLLLKANFLVACRFSSSYSIFVFMVH